MNADTNEQAIGQRKDRLREWLGERGWSDFPISDLGNPGNWQKNVYAPGMLPMEASLFASNPASLRLAYEPVGWGPPPERVRRVAARIPATISRELATQPTFGLFRSLRKDGLRIRKADYIELEPKLVQKAPLFRFRRLFIRLGLVSSPTYFEVPQALEPNQISSAVTAFFGGGSAGGVLAKAVALTSLARTQLPRGCLVVSKSDGSKLGKVELRCRPFLNFQDVGRVARSLLSPPSCRKFVEALRQAELSCNVLSFRLDGGRVIDLGLYGSPQL